MEPDQAIGPLIDFGKDAVWFAAGQTMVYLFALGNAVFLREVVKIRIFVIVGIAAFNILVYVPAIGISARCAEQSSAAESIPGLWPLTAMRIVMLAAFSGLAILATFAVKSPEVPS